MIPRIKSFATQENFQLLVTFDDGRCVRYDVGEDIRSIPAFHDLSVMYGLFRNAQLDESRTCIYWNDQIDLASDTIYEYGKDEPKGDYSTNDNQKELFAAEEAPKYNTKLKY